MKEREQKEKELDEQVFEGGHFLSILKDKEPKLTKEQKKKLKIMNKIKKAYTEYMNENGCIPSDVPSFLNFCKKKKKINESTWNICKDAMHEIQQSVWTDFKTIFDEFTEDESAENAATSI